MKAYLFHNGICKFRFFLVNILILFISIGLGGTSAYSQGMGMGMKKHSTPQPEKAMTNQISEIRSKLFKLETALEKKHQGKPEVVAGMTKKMGMKPHGSPMQKMPNMNMPGGKMKPKSNMGGMMGMKMMGRMNKNSGPPLVSSLPGFPGISHIYHMGSTDFFLDHSEHISLTIQQKTMLNQIKEKATLENLTEDRKLQQREQDLWLLTSSDQPDIKKIDEKIREIERLKGSMRLAFIQAVGKAAKVLSSGQLELLKGMKHTSI